MENTPDFTGRVALVTGGSKGIGAEIARALAAAGAAVTITGRDPDRLKEVAAALPGAVLPVAGRSHDAEHRAAAVARTIAEYGRLDLLVNNAATSPGHGLLMEQTDMDLHRKILDINVLAPLGWAQEVWRAGMAEHGGAIVNITSIGAQHNPANLGIYNISKAALGHLTRQLALELAPRVRVNAVAPAVIKTPFAEALYTGNEERLGRLYPLGRLGEVQDIAPTVLHLLSERSAWTTGQMFTIDGGLLLNAGHIGS